jgi:hypothetical protein
VNLSNLARTARVSINREVVQMGLRWLVPVFALALGGMSHAQDTQPAIIVELKFSGEDTTIEVVGKTEGEVHVPQQLGVPQLTPLFFEAVGGKDGEVVYADELRDPREIRVDRENQSDTHTLVKVDEATTFIRIPTGGKIRPKELVIYRRTSEDSEKGRSVLLRAGL